MDVVDRPRRLARLLSLHPAEFIIPDWLVHWVGERPGVVVDVTVEFDALVERGTLTRPHAGGVLFGGRPHARAREDAAATLSAEDRAGVVTAFCAAYVATARQAGSQLGLCEVLTGPGQEDIRSRLEAQLWWARAAPTVLSLQQHAVSAGLDHLGALLGREVCRASDWIPDHVVHSARVRAVQAARRHGDRRVARQFGPGTPGGRVFTEQELEVACLQSFEQ